MSIRLRSGKARIGLPLGVSAALHAGLVVLVVLSSGFSPESTAPVYAVELVAAPAGPRAVGVVTEAAPAADAPTPKRAEAPRDDAAPPVKKRPPSRVVPKKATPTPDARSAARTATGPRAGGGPEGGKGSDVANVKTAGMNFPFPAYLQNVVRQIALRFKPRNAGALHAEVMFLIRRDGTVTGIQLRQRSGSMTFDLEAMGAVEAAGTSFGALPEGFNEDVLTIIFSFDPTLIR